MVIILKLHVSQMGFHGVSQRRTVNLYNGIIVKPPHCESETNVFTNYAYIYLNLHVFNHETKQIIV